MEPALSLFCFRLLLTQQLFTRQQEHEAVAAAGFQPGKRQFGIIGFQHVAVVADFHQQHAARIEELRRLQNNLPRRVQSVFAAASNTFLFSSC